MRNYFLVAVILLIAVSAFAAIPQRAYQYFPVLKEEHALIWPDSDIGIIGSQIAHESTWKETATRKEASGVISYGVLQVLDVTYDELKKKNPLLLKGSPSEMLRARMGIRAGILYDKQMYGLVGFAESETDRYAMMLASYNGGFGWLLRDRKLAEANGYNPNKWLDNTELFSKRSAQNFKINRRYVSGIIKQADEYRRTINAF